MSSSRRHLSKSHWVLVMMLSLALIISACGAPAAPEAAAPAAEEAPAEEAAAEESGEEMAEEGAVGEVAREDTLIMAFEGGPVAAPDLANPYIAGSRINQGYMQAMWESLFYLNYESGELEPWLAESAEFNQDFTEVVITLRDGTTWSDGEAFNADDVVFTITMLQDHPTLNTWGGDVPKWVESVEAVDDTTVKFKLTASYPRFVMDFFSAFITRRMVRFVPEHIWADQDPETFRFFDPEKGWPVFTGPYTLVKASETEFVYDRRDDWWAAETGFHQLPAAKRLIFVEQGPAETGAAMLENNEIDAHTRMRFGLFETIRENNPNVISWFADAPYAWVGPCPRTFFVNNLVAPWDDPEMRHALSMAVDRQKVGDAELGGPGAITTKYTFPDYPSLVALKNEHADLFDAYPFFDYNPDLAIEIIEGKGWTRGADGIFTKDGERLSLDVTVPQGWFPGPLIAPLLTGYWNAIGVDAQFNFVSGAQYGEKRATGDYEMMVISPCASVIDSYKEVDFYHSRWVKPLGERQSLNWARWSNEEFDAIVDEMAQYPISDPELSPLWRAAMEIWLPDLPVLPLYQQADIIPQNTTYWTNWPTAQNNYVQPLAYSASTLLIIINVEKAQ